jgi:hypothetical protein
MKFAKRIYSIVCDDIREEKGNKLSLMGVYGPDIYFGKFPALLPKLCILLIFESITDKFTEINIKLKLPNAKPQVYKREVPANMPIGANFNFMLNLVPFKVEEIGEARFEVRIGDSKRTNYIHRLAIKERKTS